LLRWSSSIRGVSKYHIRALTEGSNATHLYVVIGNMGWLVDPSEHSYAGWEDPKSLAQVWTCSRHRLSWKPSSGYCSSMARLKTFKLKRPTRCLYLILSISMSYYQEGCNISEFTKVKFLISWPEWDLALRALECANKPS
jgi:hypothetical protein